MRQALFRRRNQLKVAVVMSVKLMCYWPILLLSVVMCGCGNSQQKFAAPTEIAHVSPSERMKGWLDSVAESGQLDSGVTMLPDWIEEMRQAGAANADELQRDVEELMTMKDASKLKSAAKKLSEKIEVKPAVPVK